MALLRLDFQTGFLTDQVDPGDNTLQSGNFTSLPEITGGDVLKLILDPLKQRGSAPEIVYVTGHSAGSSSVTVSRAQEGTTARTYVDIGVLWIHAPTADDWIDIVGTPAAVLATDAPGASAPGDVIDLGVSSSLARADHRHGREFLTFADHTPTFPGLTLGTGTKSARFAEDGDHIIYKGRLKFTGSTVIGTGNPLTVDLPVDARVLGTGVWTDNVGEALYWDNSAGRGYVGTCVVGTADSMSFFCGQPGTVLVSGQVQDDNPFAFANNDEVIWKIGYERA